MVVAARAPQRIGEQQAAQQEGGHDAGEEQVADGGAGQHAVEDEAERGRNQGAQERADRDQRGGVLAFVTVLAHGRDHDAADGGGFRGRRPGDAREHHAGDDADGGEAAPHPPDQHLREAHDLLRQVGGVHQASGQDEEGDGQQDEIVDAGDHALGKGDEQVQVAVAHEVDQRGHAEADRNRHADEQAEQESA